MNDKAATQSAGVLSERIGNCVFGIPHTIGNSFTAHHFSEEMFDSRMDPLLMVDHFVMTAPTFKPHLHAGISAVTAIFEDSTGHFFNRDTLGYNIALKPGDLYWLAAASGAAHDERPEDGARIHALQIFVNLPAHLKKEPARALHVRTETVPVLQDERCRVRVLVGRCGGAAGAEGTPEEMTMLDGFLEKEGHFSYQLANGRQAWVYAVAGELTVGADDEQCTLPASSATTVAAGPATDVILRSSEVAHFVLLAAKPIREPFVKHGPLVMSTAADVRRTLANYDDGKFGRISI